MEIFDKLCCDVYWDEFLAYKKEKFNISMVDIEELTDYISNRKYRDIVNRIVRGESLSIPRLVEINKVGVQKKRRVFQFDDEERIILKMLSFLLREYDELFAKNLFSFRKNYGVKKAIHTVLKKVDFGTIYSYKVDIHDYFNSVDTTLILDLLKQELTQEKALYSFLESILNNPYAVNENGETIKIKKGIMAGMPVSGFLANLYLKDMDEWFSKREIPYIRYSDDIIVFSEDSTKLREYEKVIYDFLKHKKLDINPEKEKRTSPGEAVEFLGFTYTDQDIFVSPITVKKLKSKMKRKAKALYRWRHRKDATAERTIKAYIRFLNKKFYHNTVNGEMTWCLWYFPLITSDAQLKEIDEYAISCIRYLATGNYGKKNYNLRYHEIKQMGYKSLVNNFWKYKRGEFLQPLH